MTASQLFYYSTLYSILIPIFVGFLNRHYLTKTLKLVWLLIIINFGIALASFMPVKTWFDLNDNNFLFYISALLNILIKYFIFKSLLKPKNQKIIFYVMVAFLIAIPLLTYFLGYNFRTHSLVVNIESIYSIIVCLLYLILLNREDKSGSLRKIPMFWITTGYVITNFLSIIMMTFIDQIFQYSQELFTFIWDIFSPLTNTLSYVLFTIGFIKAKN